MQVMMQSGVCPAVGRRWPELSSAGRESGSECLEKIYRDVLLV